MLSITTQEHILYGSDYPYQPNEVLQKNLENLRRELQNDKELAPYAEKILQTNAQQLFERKDKK